MPRMFLPNNRYSSTTAEDLSKRWGLSISQAALTLKAMTQKLTRSTLMPLSQRYRSDRMFGVHMIHWTMYINTMDAIFQLIHDEKCCQLFCNRQFFVEAYTIKKKSYCHLGLDKFIKGYGALDKMTYDSAQEQIGRKTKFQRVMRKYEIKGQVTETNRSNQNLVEGCIQELLQRWYLTMFKTYCPRTMWSYGVLYVAKNMQITT